MPTHDFFLKDASKQLCCQYANLHRPASAMVGELVSFSSRGWPQTSSQYQNCFKCNSCGVLVIVHKSKRSDDALGADGSPGCLIRRMEWLFEYVVRWRISPKLCILGALLPRQVKTQNQTVSRKSRFTSSFCRNQLHMSILLW